MAVGPSRKLAVILHADVVGSTALVQQNETLAHSRIQDAFRRFSETIKAYGGVTHELRGDALVAEFERASDAVTAGLAFHAKNVEYNATLDDDIRPKIRMGISIGEVVIADRTVTGAGVVLAQRLEQLAEPGGVCIQGAAYETVPRRLPFDYEYLGDQQVKGFEEPVRAYTVTLKRGEAVPAPEPSKQTKRGWIVGGAIAFFVVVAGGLSWWQPWVAREEPASIERMVSVEVMAQAIIAAIIDAAGDGAGNLLDNPTDIAVDGAGNVYVPGYDSDNVFRITPAPGKITEIIDAAGDGGNSLDGPHGIAVDGAGNVYVTGSVSDNVFQISTPAGKITEIIDAVGDGAGNPLDEPGRVAADSAGNVYVTGYNSDNAFQITPAGKITEIIDAAGDGAGNRLDGAVGVAVDGTGNVYVAAYDSDNVFRITPAGKITEIIDAAGDGAGNRLDGSGRVAVDSAGNVYVTGVHSDNAFRITPAGKITEIIDAAGDGAGNRLDRPVGIVVDDAGNVYMTGRFSDNAFRITLVFLNTSESSGGSD